MVAIVTRAGKGSPLTNAEVDANFVNLNNGKLETSNNLSDLADAAAARSNLGLGSLATQNSLTSLQVTSALGYTPVDPGGSYANPSWITSLAASKLTGIVATANLGTGTADTTTYLRGDGTWQVVSAGVSSVFGRTGAVTMLSSDVTTALGFTPASESGSYENPAWITSLATSKLSGIVATANLGTGTADATTFLRGDGTWQVVQQNQQVNVERLSGDGTTTAFTLANSYAGSAGVDVYIGGAYQFKNTYTVSGTTLTFSSPPPAGTNNIEVLGSATISIGVVPDNSVTGAKLATGAAVTNLGFTPYDSANIKFLTAQTNSAAVTELFVDGVAGSRFTIPANSTVAYTIDIVGRRIDVDGDTCAIQLRGVIKNSGGVTSDVGGLFEQVLARTNTNYAVDAAAYASNSQDLKVTVVGQNGHTINWKAQLTRVEVLS